MIIIIHSYLKYLRNITVVLPLSVIQQPKRPHQTHPKSLHLKNSIFFFKTEGKAFQSEQCAQLRALTKVMNIIFEI